MKSFVKNRRLVIYLGIGLTFIAVTIGTAYLIRNYLLSRSGPKAPVIKWVGFANTRYGYTFNRPDIWEIRSLDMSAPATEAALVNFRLKEDQRAVAVGFTMFVASNPANLSLSRWLAAHPDNGVVKQIEPSISTRIVTYNGLMWEGVPEDSVPFASGGYVKASLVMNGKIFMIIPTYADPKIMQTVMKSFKLLP